jgi:PAS domain-containing protein
VRNSAPFIENRDAGTLAQAIVDTVREPLLVLDKDLRVLAASRSFYQAFKAAPSSTLGQLFYALGRNTALWRITVICKRGKSRGGQGGLARASGASARPPEPWRAAPPARALARSAAALLR